MQNEYLSRKIQSAPTHENELGEILLAPLKSSKTIRIREYLDRNVTVVRLPEKVAKDETYPGLILDGASGVGKTQQAFALLKSGKKLIYRLLTVRQDNQQKIYEEMRLIGDAQDIFLKMVDDAIVYLEDQAREASPDQDPFSIGFLKRKAGIPDETPFKILMTHLACTTLQYDTQTAKLCLLKLEPSNDDLSEVVLFLDEVLPKKVTPQQDNYALKRLRFLRNFGRALRMRVVLAGTAATVANMIAPINEGVSDSRSGVAETAWMKIELLYQTVDLNLPAAFRTSVSHLERPLLMSILETMDKSMKESMSVKNIIRKLSESIFEQKQISAESMLIWLCGPWLQSADTIPVSPFPMSPSELVRGHFFEPAFACIVDGMHKKPYFGKGIYKTVNKRGPSQLFLSVKKFKGDVWWQLKTDAEAETNRIAPACSMGFAGIQYCLSHCVQVCLALEPILAVCLSTSTIFSNYDETVCPAKFHGAFYRLWQETLPQRTVKAIDGELNEYAMFAALQLASRSGCKYMRTLSVKEMIEPLRSLLHVTQKEPPFAFDENDDLDDDNDSFAEKNAIRYNYGRADAVRSITENEIAIIDKVFQETFMPWLVPACSLEALKDAMEQGKSDMFLGCNIAGFVPSNRNSRLDADAYLWGKSPPVRDWAFEFRARSGTYSLSIGQKDLVDKCCDDDVDMRKRFKCHAMLVAVSGSTKSEVRVWLTDSHNLRVVFVIGCGD